jgi:Carboxypeptidase regulatory-like domain
MKTPILATALAPTTSALLRSVREARRSLTARILDQVAVADRNFLSARPSNKRMRSRIVGACLLVMALAGCGGPGVLVPRSTGTVTGHVMIRACGGAYRMPETPCSVRPVTGATLAFQLGGTSTSTTTTDSTGAYRVDLPPGVYTVAISGIGPYSRFNGQRQVTVTAGNTVTADFTYAIELL